MGDVIGLVGQQDGRIAVLEGAVDGGAAEVELRARAGAVHRRGSRGRRRLALGLRLLLVRHAPEPFVVLGDGGLAAAIIGRHSRPVDWM